MTLNLKDLAMISAGAALALSLAACVTNEPSYFYSNQST